MNRVLRTFPALAAVIVVAFLEKTASAQFAQVTAEADVVLTRGPVHEAFASTVLFDPEPGVVVTRTPPPPIEELPPDQRPEGSNITWIPGYFSWDDEQNDFIWVSGVWRALPPHRQWVSGYWARTGHGHQWVSGYWADADVSEIEYLPEPPETVEAGPNIEAPSADQTWVPGSWTWHHGHYAWRPGYWAPVYSDWSWVPGHYIWTPRGYVFVDGYWDHVIANRGVLFAPVRFDSGIYARAGFSYSPRTVIDLAVFSDHLFVRPQYHHYYFGDYYSPSYYDVGFFPSFSFHIGHHGYDPIYAHERWHHRHDHDWHRHREAAYRHRREHEHARPPRTLAAQLVLSADSEKSREGSFRLATTLDRLAKEGDRTVRLQPLDKDARQKLADRRVEFQKSREERQVLEAGPSSASRESGPVKLKITKSSVKSAPDGEVSRHRSPPKRQEAPQPDLKVEPKPRKAGVNRVPQSKEARPDERRDRERPSSESSQQPPTKSKKKSKDDKDDR